MGRENVEAARRVRKNSERTNPLSEQRVEACSCEMLIFRERIVQPALEILRGGKIALRHAPADTIFYYAAQKKAFDAVICAYHDQGLIPFKLVAFQTGVNVTLGLPIIRTSPDHGTALEIAGQGKADHRSMLAAVQLACRLVAAKAKN